MSSINTVIVLETSDVYIFLLEKTEIISFRCSKLSFRCSHIPGQSTLVASTSSNTSLMASRCWSGAESYHGWVQNSSIRNGGLVWKTTCWKIFSLRFYPGISPIVCEKKLDRMKWSLLIICDIISSKKNTTVFFCCKKIGGMCFSHGLSQL